jgi:hypothetical protein
MGQPREVLSLPCGVALLLKKCPESYFPLGKRRPSDEARKSDTIVLGDLVQHVDGSSVPEENPFGIHSH